MIGATIGNFEIVAHLGKGGMGEVWLAQQPNLKTKVAIKVLAAEISQNQHHVRRFHNEAFTVGQIPHSGIVRIFDGAFLPDGRAYLVMEYLEGESLAARIKRMGPLGLPLIADFGRQIASVLDATHQAGITHRDLKPDNIYLVRDAELLHGERVKILDFGIAKLDTTVGPRMTSTTASSVGTPLYMSPEQWHSLADAGAPTDAYALGCCVFEMATGRPPFVAQTRVEVCAMHLEHPPPVPSKVREGLPYELDRLVARLLEKEPAARPSMREVIGVFTALGQGQGMALSTLPPNSVMSPLHASPESSMQYRMTPRAMQSAEFPRPDTAPNAAMSLQFKPTPVAGFESQAHMRASTDPAARPQQLAAQKPRRRGLVIALVLVAIVAIVAIVIAVTRSSASEDGAHHESGSGGSGSGSVVGSGSGSGNRHAHRGSGEGSGSGGMRRLPPRKEPVSMPEIDEPITVVVCIDEAGEVESVTLPNGGLPPKTVDAAVSSWQYEPYTQKGVPQPEVCGQTTIPARVKGPAVMPAKLTKKLFNDGIGGINEGIFKCARFAPGDQTFSVTITVRPDGVGTLKGLAVAGGNNYPRLKPCIADAIKNVRFAKTKEGGEGTTTVQLN